MVATFKNVRTLAFLVLFAYASFGLTGCNTVQKYEKFDPCIKTDCPRCDGAKVYTCPTCKGRGWLPPTFSGGLGVSAHGHNDHHHVSHGVGFGLHFGTCPRCRRKGTVLCGTTTFFWKCSKCKTTYDHAVRPCPACESNRAKANPK